MLLILSWILYFRVTATHKFSQIINKNKLNISNKHIHIYIYLNIYTIYIHVNEKKMEDFEDSNFTYGF